MGTAPVSAPLLLRCSLAWNAFSRDGEELPLAAEQTAISSYLPRHSLDSLSQPFSSWRDVGRFRTTPLPRCRPSESLWQTPTTNFGYRFRLVPLISGSPECGVRDQFAAQGCRTAAALRRAIGQDDHYCYR